MLQWTIPVECSASMIPIVSRAIRQIIGSEKRRLSDEAPMAHKMLEGLRLTSSDDVREVWREEEASGSGLRCSASATMNPNSRSSARRFGESGHRTTNISSDPRAPHSRSSESRSQSSRRTAVHRDKAQRSRNGEQEQPRGGTRRQRIKAAGHDARWIEWPFDDDSGSRGISAIPVGPNSRQGVSGRSPSNGKAQQSGVAGRSDRKVSTDACRMARGTSAIGGDG
jgi:hypothetical protein